MCDKNLPKSIESIVSYVRPVCPACSEKVEGRSDKIFCGIPCKNKHHSNARAQFKLRCDNTFGRLARNWIVLEGILGKDNNRMKIHRDILFKHGFDISSCTRAFQNSKDIIFEIGEYQCKLFEDGIVEVKRLLALSSWMPEFFERWLVDFPKDYVIGNGGDSAVKTISNVGFCRFEE